MSKEVTLSIQLLRKQKKISLNSLLKINMRVCFGIFKEFQIGAFHQT